MGFLRIQLWCSSSSSRPLAGGWDAFKFGLGTRRMNCTIELCSVALQNFATRYTKFTELFHSLQNLRYGGSGQRHLRSFLNMTAGAAWVDDYGYVPRFIR